MDLKKNTQLLKISALLLIVFSAVYLSIIYQGMGNFQKNTNDQSLKTIEKAIEKAAVLCYSIEGSYPPDVKYLKDHYGVIIDESKYFYYYEVDGANIMPKITVFKRW